MTHGVLEKNIGQSDGNEVDNIHANGNLGEDQNRMEEDNDSGILVNDGIKN
jgi:hypothetical protein